jgi:6-phosphogluconolactonase
MPGPASDGVLVYIGISAAGSSSAQPEGIHILRLDSATGALRPIAVASDVVGPGFLALHPSHRYLYATCRSSTPGQGAIGAFAVDATGGSLTLLNQQSSQGRGPCHLSVDAGGRYLFVANYGSGGVAILPIRDDGRLEAASDTVQHVGSSINPERQGEPHPHSITPDPTNRFAFACDLGLDKILCYRVDDRRGKLEPHAVPATPVRAGSGPRHLDFHPNGGWLYVINELDSTVDTFAFDGGAGTLRRLDTTSTLPATFSGENTGADIHVAPSGRFVYGSNRGHDSIAIFRVDGRTGRLTPAGHAPTLGHTPWNFGIDRSGHWLLAANRNSDSVVSFRVDPERGTLEPTGSSVTIAKPVCVRIMPA